ncbi:hypothetical protein IFHNHDMJ_01673 [Synechococcus sp. CBW1107]|nr:hypothetical protein IFHNHDMJ_01673 [Synechococcus sp. CBW1107]
MELRGPPAYLIVAVHRGLDLGIVTDCRLGVAFAEAKMSSPYQSPPPERVPEP